MVCIQLTPGAIVRIKLASYVLWFLPYAGAWMHQAADDLSSSAATLPNNIGRDYLSLSIGTASRPEEWPLKKPRYSQAASYTNERSSSVTLLNSFPSSLDSRKCLTQGSSQLPQQPPKKARYALTANHAKKPSLSVRPLELFPTSSRVCQEERIQDSTGCSIIASSQLSTGDTVHLNPSESLSDFPNLDLSLGPNASFHGPNELIQVDSSYPSKTGGLSKQPLGPVSATPASPQLDVFTHPGSKLLEDKMPQDIVHHRAIVACMRPFESLLEEIRAHPVKSTDSSRHGFKGDVFTAAVKSHGSQPLRMNRIVDSHGNCRIPSKLSRSFRKLIKHIIYFHALLPPQLFIQTRTPILHAKEITDWVFKEVFGPQKNFPILGLAKQDPPLNTQYEFSTIEKNLLAYLRTKDPNTIINLISLSMIQKCYESTHPKEWRQLIEYMSSHGLSFDVEMLRLKGVMIEKLKDLSSKLDIFPSDPLDRPTHVIENFRWPSDSGTAVENQIISNTVSEIKSGGGHAGIRNKTEAFLAKFLDKRKSFHRSPRFNPSRISGVPAVSILGATGEVMIKPMNPWGMASRNDFIVRKMNLLITTVMIRHAALMKLLKPSEDSDPPLLEKFLTWLEETIFAGNQGSLPIYGLVQQRTAPFTSEDFGEVQIYILSVLHYTQRKGDVLSALTLLGYWYKRFHKRFWNIYFGEESRFQQLIFDSSKKFPLNKDQRRLKNFH